ncbi:aminopeptidase N [Geotalea daltonii FRC-32]|uniref:Aminopeptidase N n=1 Tax=Geotalea daltonii (strain DSM 22248 / JCM 15807 / FRC-32) TaxID=316067 RepID=B9M3N1_GEODF|nr:aminopeptidase N [Geotalea daltonii]ACM21452.1 aminopeptidase N [Geotalea daltonii FRC-32]
MTESPHRTICRKDYTPPDYIVDRVELRFELDEETTRVHSRLSIMRHPQALTSGTPPLVLDGHRFTLLEIKLDDKVLVPGRYKVDQEYLTIDQVPDKFVLEITTELRPQHNTFLEGLYRSGGMFCTQCEAEGFRSITYFPDRPDVLAVYTTTIVADRQRYPVLLSNGNPVKKGNFDKGRHFVTWHDPFPKPSYLFALVAGDLVCLEDTFTTRSGRQIALRIYVNEQNRTKCDHALRSLQKAMFWDEENFGREYDLDIYMIVAVDDFNMGAMENKGLNVFNSRYVLASPETATDDDFQAIEEVIGHEYFHNWTGNRITCRDWFQLSLKEGLTIFRDQEFSADMESRGVKRIADVRYLRTAQFAEDAGPMSHPVRPECYMEINNFYTVTVYNKGAEVIRMLRTLLGPERFHQGMDLYFKRHDGQAATVEDFVRAMADAGGIDLGQFKRWYSQAGTPELQIKGEFHATTGTYLLNIRQSYPKTGEETPKEPLHIPLTMGLLDRDGHELPLTMEGEDSAGPTTRVLELRQSEEKFLFTGLKTAPVPALLRGFSAPVRLDYAYSHEELVLLMAHETDPFCRWEAGQQLAIQVMLGLVADWQAGRQLELDKGIISAFKETLSSNEKDRAFLAEALTLPSEAYLADSMAVADPDAVHAVRQFVRKRLAIELKAEFHQVHSACRPTRPYKVGDGLAGERRLANLCLAYLMTLDGDEEVGLCIDQYHKADNMTDTMGALGPLASSNSPSRRIILEEFYQRWQGDRQVVDKWFSLQAASSRPDTLAEVEKLLGHPAFEPANPNRFRSLVGAFSQANPVRFHDKSGAGYRFLTDQLIRLIPINPQVSARLMSPLTRWHRYDQKRQEMMRGELERIRVLPNLPRDVYEVVAKSLATN